MEPIKDSEEAVRAYGIHLGTEMCKKILASGIRQIHLYTLNMEKSALAILLVFSASIWALVLAFFPVSLRLFTDDALISEPWID